MVHPTVDIVTTRSSLTRGVLDDTKTKAWDRGRPANGPLLPPTPRSDGNWQWSVCRVGVMRPSACKPTSAAKQTPEVAVKPERAPVLSPFSLPQAEI